MPDEVGDGRPYLAVMSYESVTVKSDPTRPPVEVEDIFQYKNSDGRLRELRNNLLFVIAGEREIARMKDITRRRLALAELRKPEHIKNLADHQQRKVNEEFQTSLLDQAVAILQCYRHLFYPSHMAMPDTQLPVGHTAIELALAAPNPVQSGLRMCDRGIRRDSLRKTDSATVARRLETDSVVFYNGREVSC